MTSFLDRSMAFAGLVAIALFACFSASANAASGISVVHVAHSSAAAPNTLDGIYFKRKPAPLAGHVSAPSRPSGAEDEESIEGRVATNGVGLSRLALKYVASLQLFLSKRAFLVPYVTGPPVI